MSNTKKISEGKLMLAILKLKQCLNLLYVVSIQEMFNEKDFSDRYPFNDSFSDLVYDYSVHFKEEYFLNKKHFYIVKSFVNAKLKFCEDKTRNILNNDTISQIQDISMREFIFNILISYKCLILLRMKDEIIFNKEEIRNLELLAKDIISYCVENDQEETSKIFIEYTNSVNSFISEEFPNN